MVSELVLTVFFGFIGGLLRSVVGILKWQVRTTKTRKEFSTSYLTATLVLGGLLGLVAGVYVVNEPRFALLAGYAGTDFIEGLYKAKFKERKKKLAE